MPVFFLVPLEAPALQRVEAQSWRVSLACFSGVKLECAKHNGFGLMGRC